MKLLITQFSPVSCYFLPLRPKYFPLFSYTLSLLYPYHEMEEQ